jgi:peptide subunit release factor 1 (eRF1)
MRDLTEKQFVVAMARNGFTKDESLLNGFRHPDLPKPMFMTVLIQTSGHRGALKFALESLKTAQTGKTKAGTD